MQKSQSGQENRQFFKKSGQENRHFIEFLCILTLKKLKNLDKTPKK